MWLSQQGLVLSAMDLSHFMVCKHLTTLDQSGALRLIRVPDFRDPGLASLQNRGLELEEQYLDKLQGQGLEISLPGDDSDLQKAIARTIEAMRAGVDIIYQASLKLNNWQGRADFLRKINKPSKLGSWSYEVIDTKLALETRATTILQLCLYSEMIADVQGVMPEYSYVVTTDIENEIPYRLDDFAAYYRYIKKHLITATQKFSGPDSTYPQPCAYCQICNWWENCNKRLRQDDHLSYVAGLGKNHRSELTMQAVKTMKELAEIPFPIPFKPNRGSIETYERLRNQARVQVEARTSGKPVYEFLDITTERGFFKLPNPSTGDIFFDFEGDPFIKGGGLEYLFGWVTINQTEQYHKIWALDDEQEKKAFEEFVDTVMGIWKEFPDMHIYHFTAYEPSRLKRLTGKYASKENEIDEMLRAGLFVDLHTVTRQAIYAGVETYSLKDLEKFHGFERKQELRAASKQLREVERRIEANNKELTEETIHAVENYNREDCVSTRRLRDWLESLRAKKENEGHMISRPQPGDGSASEELTAEQQRIAQLIESLLDKIPVNRDERNAQQQAIWLLANMLDWYRREEKATWWEFFRLCELSPDEMMEEKAGIGGLTYTGKRATDKKSVIDEYIFAPQDFELRTNDEVSITPDGKKKGIIHSINESESRIYIKKGPSNSAIHPESIFTLSNVSNKVKAQSIERIAQWVLQNGIDSAGEYLPGRKLLMNHAPGILTEIRTDLPPSKEQLNVL
jgi:uncharacterized protein